MENKKGPEFVDICIKIAKAMNLDCLVITQGAAGRVKTENFKEIDFKAIRTLAPELVDYFNGDKDCEEKWRDITKSSDLILAARNQGIILTEQEATVIIDYLEAHSYVLTWNGRDKTGRRDPDDPNYKEEYDYTIKDAIIFCQNTNESFSNDPELIEAISIERIKTDRKIIDSLMERFVLI